MNETICIDPTPTGWFRVKISLQATGFDILKLASFVRTYTWLSSGNRSSLQIFRHYKQKIRLSDLPPGRIRVNSDNMYNVPGFLKGQAYLCFQRTGSTLRFMYSNYGWIQ